MPNTPLTLAIVGSGPAGCYLAQSLLRAVPEVEITVFDRLASPFGLIRYGVAADHQHTKAITRQFERLFTDARVRFAGNVELGAALPLDRLRACYDVVVLATGLASDRALRLPGDALDGVHGAGELTRTLNSHPGERPRLPELGSDVVIIGGGNVAIDLLRFLVKEREDFAASDISDHALDSYLRAPAQRVTLLNRSDPTEAKSDPQMLKELAALPRARYRASGAEEHGIGVLDSATDRTDATDEAAISGASNPRAAAARLAALRELTSPARVAAPGPEVSLRFRTLPLRLLDDGAGRVCGVEVARGEQVESIRASSVITAIGFETGEQDPLAALLATPADSGRLERGLYRTGWAKRGPQGAIPENRACAKAVADEILHDLATGEITVAGLPGYAGLPPEIRSSAVDYAQWLRIEQHERENAPTDRIRRKLPDHRAMIDIATAP